MHNYLHTIHTHCNCKGTSRVSLSKSSELVSTKSSISVRIAFLLFLASSVCIM